jgi:negative regulator of flagellin synthesis FlgM
MSNTIQKFTSGAAAEGPGAAAKPQAAQDMSKTTPAVAPQTDSVTLSNAAQASTALLAAARGASGIDQPNVAAIKSALANGSYNVSPETLAQAISTVLRETQA